MKENGFTLFELIIVIVVISVITSVTVTVGEKALNQFEQTRRVAQFMQTLRFARIEAIQLNAPVSVKAINGNWCQGMVVYLDLNKTGQVAEKDEIKVFAAKKLANCHIVWKGFPNRSYVRFLPEGTTDYQNGRFTFKGVGAGSIVVSQTGRIRRE